MAEPRQSQSKRQEAVTTTSAPIAVECTGKVRRIMLVLTNLSTDVATVHFGDDAVVAGVGITLLQNQSYIESDTNRDGFTWQGAIQAISAGTSNVDIIERFQETQ